MTEVERPVLTAMMNRAVFPEGKRDAAAADAAEKTLAQPLKVLDGAIGRSANLLGDNFTVADLNVASILAWARPDQAKSEKTAAQQRKAGGFGNRIRCHRKRMQ
jgi:glutathione S-transferase